MSKYHYTLFISFVLCVFAINLFAQNTVKFVTDGQQFSVADLDHFWISPTQDKNNSIEVRCEIPDGSTDGSRIPRSNAIDDEVWGQFGNNHSGEVWYENINVGGTQYIKIRYSKDGPETVPIEIFVNDEKQAEFQPEDQRPKCGNPPGCGWNEFEETRWIKLNFPPACTLAITNNTLPDPISSSGGNFSLNIELDGSCSSGWSITSKPDWVTVSPSSSGSSETVDIIVSENNATSPRSGIVTVEAADASGSPINITINQNAACNLSISNNSIPNTVPPAGGNYSFQVNLAGNCSSGWSITNKPSWVTVSPSSSGSSETVNVMVSRNSSSTSRSGNIQFEADSNSENISISQEGETQWVLEFRTDGQPPSVADLDHIWLSSTMDTSDAIQIKCEEKSSSSGGGMVIQRGNAIDDEVWGQFGLNTSSRVSYEISGEKKRYLKLRYSKDGQSSTMIHVYVDGILRHEFFPIDQRPKCGSPPGCGWNEFEETEWIDLENLTSIDLPNPTLVPKEYVLHQNFPNPFNPTTTIKFGLPQSSNVKLTIFDLNGQLVKKVLDTGLSAGTHQVIWNSKDYNGHNAPSGFYIYRLSTNYGNLHRKLLLIR